MCFARCLHGRFSFSPRVNRRVGLRERAGWCVPKVRYALLMFPVVSRHHSTVAVLVSQIDSHHIHNGCGPVRSTLLLVSDQKQSGCLGECANIGSLAFAEGSRSMFTYSDALGPIRHHTETSVSDHV